MKGDFVYIQCFYKSGRHGWISVNMQGMWVLSLLIVH